MDSCSEEDSFSFLLQMLKPLREDLRVGLKKKGVFLKEFNSGALKKKKNKSGEQFDRFKVCFELAGDQITWEIVFDLNSANAAPDIIFGQDDAEFCPNIEDLEGFRCWNISSASSLNVLVTDVIEQYVSYQKGELLSLPRLKGYWEELLLSGSPYAVDCEVHILKNGPGVYNTAANFLFNLPVDLTNIPAYLTKDNPGEDKVCLHVSFQAPNLSYVQSRLFLSARVEHALGGKESLRIPPFGNLSMLAYIKKLEQYLQNTVSEVCQRYEKRKELIATFISEFPGSVIEYDPEGFYDIILLLELNNVFFILFVMLGNRYPQDPPAIILQSIMHATPQGPYRENRNDFRYSPRWESQKIVEKIREYLIEVLPLFQQAAKRY